MAKRPLHPVLKDSLDRAAYLALRLVIMTIQALPICVCQQGATVLAWLAGQVIGFRRQLVDDNLQRALPHATAKERKALARGMWQHLFTMVIEIAHAPRKVHRSTWRQHCQVRQMHAIVSQLLSDRPTVLLSGHYSNFEFGGYMLGLFGFPSHTVARVLDNAYVDRFVNDFRGRTGQHILPKNGSREAIESLLAQGGTLTLLGDQAAGQKACWVNFFGKPASTNKAIGLFTLAYDAPTLVLGTRRIGSALQFEVELEGAIDPHSPDFSQGSAPAVIEWFTRHLEAIILKSPEQYWWVHRRWKGTPPEKVAKRLASCAA